ncbi:MAG: hypothetical protein HQM01_08245 [Magnetococcales bacterium]|nr:hypothetical protein [Magnetococcales bacterium]
MPDYLIHVRSFINDTIVDPADHGGNPVRVTVSELVIPGPHWEPVDNAAKEICKKVGHKFDPELIGIADDSK